MQVRLYTLRHKDSAKGAQVISRFIEVPVCASHDDELRLAVQIAEAYCAESPGRRYIAIEDAIVAGPSLLPADVLASLEPKGKAQKAQDKAQ